MTKFYFIYIVSFLFSSATAFSNQSIDKVDSLLSVINKTKSDSIKCELYYLVLNDMIYDDPERAKPLAFKYLESAQKTRVSEEISAYNQLGIVYFNLGIPDKTIEYFSAAINLLEDGKDDFKIGSMLNNLAYVFGEMKQYDKELEYYYKSLNKRIPITSDSSRLSSLFGNIGLNYLRSEQLDSANKYISLSYKFDLQNGDSSAILYSTAAMAEYFQKIKAYDSAKTYFERVEQIIKNLGGFSQALCENYVLKGKLYLELGEYEKALKNFELAKNVAEERSLIQNKTDIFKGLAQTLEKVGKFKEANIYLNKFLVLNDSIYTAETKKQLESAELNQKEKEILLLTQKSEIDTLRIKQSRYLIIGIFILLVIAGIVAFTFFNKNKFIKEVLDIVSNQRNVIAAKNQHIIDSITYAKGIQDAIFPNEEDLKSISPNSFLFHKAVDMVSGDFFWFTRKENEVIIGVLDCTGHGVPGAIMTVMTNSLMNQIINEKNITEPREILHQLHKSIINTWQRHEVDILQSNGLDAVICKIDIVNKEISFSGAKRPLYVVRDSIIHEFKGNPYSIGFPYYNDIEFKQHDINFKEGDSIYMFTDGIPDQFGGERNKKFLGKRLKSLILSLDDKKIKKKETIEKAISDWQGSNEQTDDMQIIGIKLDKQLFNSHLEDDGKRKKSNYSI